MHLEVGVQAEAEASGEGRAKLWYEESRTFASRGTVQVFASSSSRRRVRPLVQDRSAASVL
jgi:hypothetical protein